MDTPLILESFDLQSLPTSRISTYWLASYPSSVTRIRRIGAAATVSHGAMARTRSIAIGST